MQTDRRGAREVVVALVLAVVTGGVDAVGFTHLFSVFPANQSGNLILLGIGVGGGSGSDAWRPGLALVAFVVGVVTGVRGTRRLPATRRAPALLVVETVALVVVAAWAGDVGRASAPDGRSAEAVLLALAAFAMGIQTDVIRRAAQVSVATTYQTGALVRMGDALAGGVPTAVRRGLVVLGALVVAYVGGAALGTALVNGWGHGLWLVPAATAAVGVWVWCAPLDDVGAA